MVQSTTNKKAFVILEIIIATTLFALLSVGAVYLALDTMQNDSKTQFDSEALLYAQEGLEAVRNMRDRDFASLTNGDHGLELVSGEWQFIAAPEDVDGFYSRTIIIEDVYRDEFGDIAETGDLDPEIKRVISEVTWLWKGFIDRPVTLTTYLSNWPSDDWVQTTCTEFDAGAYTDTETVSADSPPADNCTMQIATILEPSSFFSSANVGSHGEDVVVDGNYAYVAVSKTQKGFAVVDISDPLNPSVVAELNVGGKGRYVAKQGNYVYVGVNDFWDGLAVIDVSDPVNPSVTPGIFSIFAGNQPAPNGDYMFMGIERFFYSFISVSISDPENSYIVDWLNLWTNVRAVRVSGNYAYLGADNDWEGFRIVDISDPTDIDEIATLDVGEEVNAVEISGSVVYLGTEQSNDSLQVLNVSDPYNPVITTSIDVDGEIEDLVINGDKLYAAIDNVNAGLAVIDISNPLYPTLSYKLDVQGKAEGIATDGDYIYLAIDVNNSGLVIIGVGEEGITTSGTYTSDILDGGSEDVDYNFLDWDHIEVPGGAIKFQLRSANSTGNIASATWVGPDGTTGTYYETARTPIVLDPARTGQRYIQIQAFLESDGITTPVLESIRINYNP